MNLTSETAAGLRRAALALHSLGQTDRGWLLQQLPFEARQSLEELLIELSELGIPPDAAVIRAALFETSASDVLSPERAAGMCLVLTEQKPALQGMLLAALPESQRGEVLRHWPHDVLARPGAVVGQNWMPALQEAVLRSWHDLVRSRGERIT